MPYHRLLSTVLILITLTLAACTNQAAAPRADAVTMPPLLLTADLGEIDLCRAIPQAAVEAALGARLTAAPQRFTYGDASASSGCQYDAGADSQGAARFAYVALAPVAAYGQQPQAAAVSGIGSAAYFTDGADARQLWVRLGDKAALVVAIGDRPNEEGLTALAQLVAGAIKE